MGHISKENAYIFRITHIDNVPWILKNGLHCNTSGTRDPNFRTIGNPGLIDRRSAKWVPERPGGTLSDYVPFYFTSHSMMLYNIKTGYNGLKQFPMSEIAIIISSMHRLAEVGLPFLFTDRHALVMNANFTGDLDNLDWIDWKVIESREFRKKTADDLERCERYQAEALIHRHMPVSAMLGMALYGEAQKARIAREVEVLSISLKLATKPEWYF
jgi:hypothetical protein